MTELPESEFQPLLEMGRCFQHSLMLMSAVELNLFDFLEEPRSAAEAAAYLKGEERATDIFMNGLAALGLLVKGVDYFRNGKAASRFLVRGKPDYRGAIIRHMHHTLRGWLELKETVLVGHPPEVEEEKWLDRQKERSEEEVRAFICGMDAIARDLAPQVAAKLDLSGAASLLDLGGGPATYAIEFCRANPKLTATVFDLPGPVKIAQEHIAKHGLGARIATRAGNFLQDDIGGGYDFIWVSQILHSHDEDQCRLIIGKCVQALKAGGTLAIQDFYLNDDGCTPPRAAMFSVHMLAVTPRGRAYFHQEVAEWLEEAGLKAAEFLRSSPDAGILLAKK